VHSHSARREGKRRPVCRSFGAACLLPGRAEV